MDATIAVLGSGIAFAGVLATALVAAIGKRGENALSGLNSLTDQLQEELTRKKQELAEKNAELAKERSERAADAAEIARLRALVIQLGGTP